MKRFRGWILVALAVILTAVLYLLPGTPAKETPKNAESIAVTGFEGRLESLKKDLSENDRKKLASLEEGLKKSGDASMLDSIGRFWDKAQVPYASSHYFEEIAKKQPGEKNFLNAAIRYFDAYKEAETEGEKHEMTEKSMEFYQKVLKENPGNLDAKCDLGVLYAEGSSEPMKGIMLLREVIGKNPEHENAQFNLGILSVKSNQLDKALERFDIVTRINPNNYNAYLFKSKVLVDKGEKEKAIETLNKLKKLTNDPRMRRDVDEYIKNISSN